MNTKLFFFTLAVALALGVSCSSVHAADVNWTGAGADGNWGTSSNWSAAVPVDGDQLIFSGSTRQTNTNTLAAAFYSGLVFSNGGFEINGNGLGLSGKISSSGVNVLNTALEMGGTGTRLIETASGGTLTLNGNIDLAGRTLQENSLGTTIFNGSLIGPGTLSIGSLGADAILGGNNSGFAGTINVFRRAKITSATALGGASTTLLIDRSIFDSYIDLNGQSVSGVNLSFVGSGTTTLGRLRNTSAGAASFGGNIALNTTGGVDGSGQMTLSGELSGTGGLTKSGTGRLILSGQANYSGATSIEQGELFTQTSSTMTISSAINIAAGAALQENSLGTVTFNGNITGSGDFRILSLGQAVLGGDNSAFAGTLTVSRFARITSGLSLGGAATTLQLNRDVDSAFIDLNGQSVSGVDLQFIGSNAGNRASLRNTSGSAASFGGDIQLGPGGGVDGAGNVALGGVLSGSGGITKLGTGTLTLSGNNTYTGDTVVTAGSLIIDGSQAAATGVLSVAAGATLGGSGTIGGATTISGIHSPGNSAGVQTFGSNLTYSGTPTVQWELIANTTTQASPTPVFDQIVVNGNLNFAAPTTLTLNFALTESGVDWSNSLWASDITGTSGWLLYDVAGTLSNFDNLSISVDNWADGQGDLFNTVRAGSSFSLYNDNVSGDIYLNYAVPEPSTYALLTVAAVGLGAHVVRRRRARHSTRRRDI